MNDFNYYLPLILSGIMLFAYWLNYIMGSPLATDPKDVDQKAILFSVPESLSNAVLKDYGLYEERQKKLRQELQLAPDRATKDKMISDARLGDLLEARELFTWQRSLLCPICLHWWLTVIVGIFFLWFDLFNARADFFLAAFYYLVLHLIIRKIS